MTQKMTPTEGTGTGTETGIGTGTETGIRAGTRTGTGRRARRDRHEPGAAYLSCDRSEVVLSLGRVPGAGTGSDDDESGGGGSKPHGEDDLSCCIPVFEGLGDLRTGQDVRGGAAGAGGQRRSAEGGSGRAIYRILLG